MTFRAALAVLVTGLAAVPVAGLRAQSTADAIPSAVEQALMERACTTPATVLVTPERHDECLHARLTALRDDFGVNLGRLSAAERRKIDTTCGAVRGAQGRDGYVDCLGSELVGIRNRWPARATVPNADATAAPVSTTPPEAAAVIVPAAPSSRILPAVMLTTVLSVSIAVPLLLRKRRARVCAVCKARVEQAGAMCPTCRHEAAEVQRRAAAERLERQAEQDRLKREQEDDEQRRLVREAEQARVQQQELARRNDETRRQEEDARRLEAETADRQRRAAAHEDPAVFDPYAILGVPRDASLDAIREAHEQAQLKYDFEHVADLGFEIQQHYRTKAEAVNRAFRMLTESHQHAASC